MRPSSSFSLAVAAVAVLCSTSAYAYMGTTSDPVFNDALSFSLNAQQVAVKFLNDYTRARVPSIAAGQLSLKGGSDPATWVSVTYIRNEGRPMIWDGAPLWTPLCCLWNRSPQGSKAVLAFKGCYEKPTRVLPRVDTPDPFFVEGSEVFGASRVIVEFVSGAQLPFYPNLTDAFTPHQFDTNGNDADDDDDDGGLRSFDGSNTATIQVESKVRGWGPQLWATLKSWFGASLQVTVPIRQQTYADKQYSIYDVVNTPVAQLSPGVTPQLRTMHTYFQSFPTNNYPSLNGLFADDATFSVTGLTNYSGAPVVIAYQLLADYSVSDLIRINGVAWENIMQQGHLVMIEAMVLSDFPHNAGTPVPQIWNNKYMVKVEFNPHGQIQHFTQSVNLLDAFIRQSPARALNPQFICQLIQKNCVNSITMDQFPQGAQQYPSVDACVSYLQSIPLNGPTVATQTFGKSVSCVEWHAELTSALPQHHCLHTGPLKISPFLTPCQDFA